MSADAANNAKAAKYRQYLLGGVCAVMVVYFGGTWVLDNLLQGPIEEARKTTAKLNAAIEQREKALSKARAYLKVLEIWEGQSVPGDTEVARSLYQAWLVELVSDVGLTSPSVNSTELVSRKGVYNTLSFSVRGRGTLEQLTRFLFGFYQTDLLHQIRSVNISPVLRSDQLDLSLSIEALVLAPRGTAPSQDQETVFATFRERVWRVSDRLASPTLADYDAITRRNLFGMSGAPDPADFTYLTSVSAVDGEPQAWFKQRTTDEVFRLGPGDVLHAGTLACTVVEIVGPDVVLETEGERWLLSLGDKLTDAFALPPEY